MCVFTGVSSSSQESPDHRTMAEREGQPGPGWSPSPADSAPPPEIPEIVDSLPTSQDPEGRQAEENSSHVPTVLDYDFSAPFSQLKGMAGLARPILDNTSRSRPATPCQRPPVHSAGYAQPSARGHGKVATTGNLQSAATSASTGGEATQEGDTHGGVGAAAAVAALTSEGGSCSAQIQEENASTSIQKPSSLDSHINAGISVSDVSTLLTSPSVHGHTTDSRIRVGKHILEVAPPLPVPSIHGHPSDSHIGVGDHAPQLDAPLPPPRHQSVHGHSSDSHIRVGEHVSDVAPSLPFPNMHGHNSKSHIRVGENVSEVALPRQIGRAHV